MEWPPACLISKGSTMQLRIGYALNYSFPQPTPIILLVDTHDSRASAIVIAARLITEPSVPISTYRDAFGNRCHRVLAPTGRLRLTADGVVGRQPRRTRLCPAPGRTLYRICTQETLVFLFSDGMATL